MIEDLNFIKGQDSEIKSRKNKRKSENNIFFQPSMMKSSHNLSKSENIFIYPRYSLGQRVDVSIISFFFKHYNIKVFVRKSNQRTYSQYPTDKYRLSTTNLNNSNYNCLKKLMGVQEDTAIFFDLDFKKAHIKSLKSTQGWISFSEPKTKGSSSFTPSFLKLSMTNSGAKRLNLKALVENSEEN